MSKERRVKGKGSCLISEPNCATKTSQESRKLIHTTRPTTVSMLCKWLVWRIKKSLIRLSASEAHEVAKAIDADYQGAERLDPTDEESCINHILDFMYCEALLESEDEGISHLLAVSDVVKGIIKRNDDDDLFVAVASGVTLTSSAVTQITHPVLNNMQSQNISPPTNMPPVSLISGTYTQP